jgi:ribosomal protein S27AE
MSIIASMFSGKQTCPNCGQTSSPKRGEGDWELCGMMHGWPSSGSRRVLQRCVKCGAGLIVGVFGDHPVSPEEMSRLKPRGLW